MCGRLVVSCANSWRLDYLSHSNTMEVWKPAWRKTAKFHWNEHTPGGSDHLFLFPYANHLLWDRVFVLIFNIYLFISSKWCPMSRKAGGTDHLFLFTYANQLLYDRVFILIFSIYLFIYSKWCQQNQVEATTFITACNKVGARLCFYIEN